MANAKTGLNYYTIDTDRYQDRRIKRLKKDMGCNGMAVYDYILCEIYRVQGCFLEWDENTAFDVAEYFGLKESAISEIVRYCGVVGLFDKGLLSRGIITSESIQRRYLEMCARAKRRDIVIPEKYRIIPEESRIIPEECAKTPEVCPQSKVKESKEKKNKRNSLSISPSLGSGDSSEITSAEPTEREREIFFKIFFFKNYKNPALQVDRFINHYKASGWRRAGGVAVVDRVALANSWEPKDAELKNRFEYPFLPFWEHIYNQLSQIGAAQYGLHLMLRGLQSVRVDGSDLIITISFELHGYLSKAGRFISDALNKYYPNRTLKYRIIRPQK